MPRFIIVPLGLMLFSCYKTNVTQYESWNQDPATKASGYQVTRLSRQYNVFGGARFLSKYDDTMWADTENYYSNFSDIKFERHGPTFISFFNIDKNISYCKGWKKEENIYDGIKWYITFKKDEEDIAKGIVKFLVDIYDESNETVGIATILTMVKKIDQSK